MDFKKGGLVVAAQKRNTKLTVDAVDENMNVKIEEDIEKVAKKDKPLDKDDVIEVIFTDGKKLAKLSK